MVSTSMSQLIFPKTYGNQEFIQSIEDACKMGKASFYASGEEPGFAEQLAALICTGSNTIESVTTSEIMNYSPVVNREQMEMIFGFGQTEDYQSMIEMPGVLSSNWGAPINYLAYKLGYELEGIEEMVEKRLTDHDIKVGYGVVPAGTVGAVKFCTSGIINGRKAISVEHVTRMDDALAPDWPQAERDGTIQIRIKGDPNLNCDFVMGDPARPGDQSYEGYVLTSMRVTNAVPYVCEARTGMLISQELELTTPASAFRSDETAFERVREKVCKFKNEASYGRI